MLVTVLCPHQPWDLLTLARIPRDFVAQHLKEHTAFMTGGHEAAVADLERLSRQVAARQAGRAAASDGAAGQAAGRAENGGCTLAGGGFSVGPSILPKDWLDEAAEGIAKDERAAFEEGAAGSV
jgi:hypothetical protein